LSGNVGTKPRESPSINRSCFVLLLLLLLLVQLLLLLLPLSRAFSPPRVSGGTSLSGFWRRDDSSSGGGGGREGDGNGRWIPGKDNIFGLGDGGRKRGGEKCLRESGKWGQEAGE
jgi:hypothetical protein